MEWILIIVGVLLIGVAVYFYMFPGRKGHSSPQERINALHDKSHPNQTRYEARKEAGASIARTEELQALAGEAEATIHMVSQQTQLENVEFHHEHQPQQLEERRRLESAQMTNQEQFVNKATELGIDPVILSLTEQSQIEVNKARQLAEIDIERRWKEIVQDLDAADLLHLSEQQLINKLTGYYEELLRKKHEIEIGADPEPVKNALLARYDKNIKSLEGRIDDRQDRLVLSENGKEVKRLETGEGDRRADYPPESDEDAN
jgi:predicted transcriptional regulator